MKKLFTLLCLFLLTTNATWALTATFNLGVKNGISVPEGYFKSVGEKFNWNNKFNGGEYDGISFSQGLKMEADTKIGFTTEDVSVVTIVQSTFSDATIKFDGEELPIETAEAGTGCRIYTLKNVPAGDHVIGRGSGESGLFYVKVEEANTVTFINDRATMYGQRKANLLKSSSTTADRTKPLILTLWMEAYIILPVALSS